MTKRLKYIGSDLSNWYSSVPPDKVYVWVMRRLAPLLTQSPVRLPGHPDNSRVAGVDIEDILPTIHRNLGGIGDSNEADQLKRIKDIYRAARDFATTAFFVQQRRALREQGVEIWNGLPKGLFDLALQVAATEGDYETQPINLAVLLPGLQEHRPDLLPEFGEAVENVEDDFQKAALFVCLAYYLPADRQESLIDKALSISAGLYDQVENICGLILQDVAEYAHESLLLSVANWLMNFNTKDRLLRSYSAALVRFASRIGDNMALLERVWTLIPKMGSSSYCDFVEIVAPNLDSEHLRKLLLLTWQRDDQDKLQQAVVSLRKRWVSLPAAEAYDVWYHLLHSLSTRSRENLLEWIAWLPSVMNQLGGEEAVISVGNQIIDVASWDWR